MTAVEAMRAGAFDFVEKPLDLEQLELRVARAIEHQKLLHEVSVLRAECNARRAGDEIIGASELFARQQRLVELFTVTSADNL